MSGTFEGATAFNQDISQWSVCQIFVSDYDAFSLNSGLAYTNIPNFGQTCQSCSSITFAAGCAATAPVTTGCELRCGAGFTPVPANANLVRCFDGQFTLGAGCDGTAPTLVLCSPAVL